jgi:hypothetical protein
VSCSCGRLSDVATAGSSCVLNANADVIGGATLGDDGDGDGDATVGGGVGGIVDVDVSATVGGSVGAIVDVAGGVGLYFFWARQAARRAAMAASSPFSVGW